MADRHSAERESMIGLPLLFLLLYIMKWLGNRLVSADAIITLCDNLAQSILHL